MMQQCGVDNSNSRARETIRGDLVVDDIKVGDRAGGDGESVQGEYKSDCDRDEQRNMEMRRITRRL